MYAEIEKKDREEGENGEGGKVIVKWIGLQGINRSC